MARPYIANAAATTAEVWWTQGFVPEEDVAFKKFVADYEKASGNTIDSALCRLRRCARRSSSAMTSGIVPDLFHQQPGRDHCAHAWDDKLVDVTDVVETQKEEYTETALLNTYCYNNVEKKRSFYGVPYTTDVFTNHVWRPLVEKAGYKIEDIPKTWDAYYDFFKDVQKKLRAQGMRNVYGLGFNVTTNGNDPNDVFNYFLIAYGGQDIVTKDGKLHLDDPKVREAAIKALTYPTTAYKEGFVPPGAINWNDADDNNAFHAKQIVMDLDGTISTEVAVLSQGKKQDYDDIVTMGLPLSNDGKPVPSQAGQPLRPDPERAQRTSRSPRTFSNISSSRRSQRVAEDGARPQYSGDAVDREERPVVARPKDPHRAAYVQQGLLGPTVPNSGSSTRPMPRSRTSMSGARLGRHHEGRDGAAGGGGEGVQAGRGDLRKIPDRLAEGSKGGPKKQQWPTAEHAVRCSAVPVAASAAGRELGPPLYRQAAATTAAVWWTQGFAQEEDISFKKIVADYEKASGNTIDYSITPYAPMRQKIVSAVTERRRPGPVPEHPGRDHCALRLGRQAGRRQRRRRDATGGIHRDRAAHGPLLQQCREEAQLLRCALYRRRFDEPYLAAAGREGRLPDGGPAEDLGCLLRFLQGGAEETARPGHAQCLWPWFSAKHRLATTPTHGSTIS